MVANFNYASISESALKLNAHEPFTEQQTNTEILLNHPYGSTMMRVLARLWAEIQAGAIYNSDIVLKEIEDDVVTAFILSLQESKHASRATPAQVRLAEEYLSANLCSPVTRDELAVQSGVSIRTLSRWFTKRHGVGPMKFLKERRLDAAYKELLCSTPESTKVTDVALRYGYTHLGKFAIEYKMVIRESPSETLLN